MNAIADIRLRIEHGASVNEVISAYDSHEFPELEKVESQMAMIKAVERVGQSATVQEVLQQECAGKKEIDLQNVGFKALISTIEKESFKVDEVITQFQPTDFEEEVVQERLGQLVTEAQQLDIAEVSKQTTELELGSAEEQTVTQVSASWDSTLSRVLNHCNSNKHQSQSSDPCIHIDYHQATEIVHETRKVSFKQEEVHVKTASSTEMSSATATATRQETQVMEQSEQQGN